MRGISSSVLAATAVLFATAPAHAARSSFQVSATVLGTCGLSASGFILGSDKPSTGTLTGKTTITIACTSGTSYTLAFAEGPTVLPGQRLMLTGRGIGTPNVHVYSGPVPTSAYRRVAIGDEGADALVVTVLY